MNDIEERITEALRSRAEGEIDSTALAAGAAARGRTRAVRRRVGLACGGLVLVAAVVAVPALVPAGSLSVLGPADGWTQPPAAAEAPGAVQRPDLVGTDPNVLHFGVDPRVGQLVNWTSDQGTESVQVRLGGERLITVDIGRDADALDELLHDGALADRPREWADTTVAGLPARVGSTGTGGRVLRWSPVDGLWVKVSTFADTADDIRMVAEGLWLNEARRCSVPFQLTALPQGAEVRACSVNARGYPGSVEASLIIEAPGGRAMEVQIQYLRGMPWLKAANYEVAGQAAFLYPARDELELLGHRDRYVSARIGKAYGGFGVEDAALVLGGLRMADPEDLASWPTPLVAPAD